MGGTLMLGLILGGISWTSEGPQSAGGNAAPAGDSQDASDAQPAAPSESSEAQPNDGESSSSDLKQMPDTGEVVLTIPDTGEEAVRWSASEVELPITCADDHTYPYVMAINFEVDVYEAYSEAIFDFEFMESDFTVTDREGNLDKQYGSRPVTRECLSSADALPQEIPPGTSTSGAMTFQTSFDEGYIIYEGRAGTRFVWEFSRFPAE